MITSFILFFFGTTIMVRNVETHPTRRKALWNIGLTGLAVAAPCVGLSAGYFAQRKPTVDKSPVDRI